MSRRDDLPRLDELPIPRDVRPGPGWTEQMLEMADHIGPYATLVIVDRFGGTPVYISQDASRCPFGGVIDADTANTIARIYGRNRLDLPVGREALSRARRASLIAAVRVQKFTVIEAALIAGTSRTYMSHLVNLTDEGQNAAPLRISKRHDPRQLGLFGEPDVEAAE